MFNAKGDRSGFSLELRDMITLIMLFSTITALWSLVSERRPAPWECALLVLGSFAVLSLRRGANSLEVGQSPPVGESKTFMPMAWIVLAAAFFIPLFYAMGVPLPELKEIARECGTVNSAALRADCVAHEGASAIAQLYACAIVGPITFQSALYAVFKPGMPPSLRRRMRWGAAVGILAFLYVLTRPLGFDVDFAVVVFGVAASALLDEAKDSS